jgi:hypothetical protein
MTNHGREGAKDDEGHEDEDHDDEGRALQSVGGMRRDYLLRRRRQTMSNRDMAETVPLMIGRAIFGGFFLYKLAASRPEPWPVSPAA